MDGMWSGVVRVIVLALVAGAACQPTTGGGDAALIEEPPLVIGQRLAQGPASPGDTEFFFAPTSLFVQDDTIVVIDTGNDRVVYLDRDLRFLGAVGREGEGPGELSAPTVARSHADTIVISEMENGRFTLLVRDGRFVRTLAVPGPFESFAVASDGALILPSRSGSHWATRVTEAGRTPIARREATPTASTSYGLEHGLTEPWVALTAGDTLHVFDGETGTLHKFSPAGLPVVSRRLPGELLQALFARRARFAEAFPGLPSARYAPLIKNMSVTPAGDLLLVFTAGRTAGLLIDPVHYRARRLAVPDTTGDWMLPVTARDIAIDGDRVFLLSQQSAHVFALDRPAAGR